MHTAIGIFVVCLGAVFATPGFFKPGMELEFHYGAQVSAGVPNSGSQVGGFAINATAKAQFIRDDKVIVAVTGVKVFEIAGSVPAGAMNTILSGPFVTRVAAAKENAMKAWLLRPIRCTYRHGLIVAVETYAAEPAWSVNLKRGLLAMLQVNVLGAGAVKDVHPDASIADLFMDNSASAPLSASRFFRVFEAGVAGKCEVAYAITAVPSIVAAQAGVLAAIGCPCSGNVNVAQRCACAPWEVLAVTGVKSRVIKSTNLKSCVKPATVEHGLFGNLDVVAGISGIGKDMVISSVVTDAIIAGAGTPEWGIQRAVQVTKYAFAPFAETAGRMEANVIQTLLLVKAKALKVEHVIKFTEALVVRSSGLRLEIAPKWAPIFAAKVGVPVAEKMLSAICAPGAFMDRSTPIHVMKTVEVLRQMSTADVKAIVMTYVLKTAAIEEGCPKYIRELILDVLPTIASPKTLPVLVDILRSKIVSPLRKIMIVNTVALTLQPTIETTEMILAVVEKIDTLALAAPVRRTLILAVGTQVNKLFWKAWKGETAKVALLPVVNKAVAALKAIFLKATEFEVKMTVIKAIGNSGLPEFLPILESLITNPSRAADMSTLRAQAIYSLRRIAPFVPTKALSILVPIYLNPVEVQAVRVACFVAIMDMQPACTVVMQIAHSLKGEPNTQIASFVYTYLTSMSRSSLPNLKPLAACCRHAVMALGPFVPATISSKAIHMDAFMSSLQAGIGMNLFVANKPTSPLPTAVIGSLDAFLFGQAIKVAEFGVEGAAGELPAILKALVGKSGILTEVVMGKKSIADVVAAYIASVGGATITDKIFASLEKMGIYYPKQASLNTAVYMKLFGSEIASFGLWKNDIRGLVGDGAWVSSMIGKIISAPAVKIDMLKAIALIDNTISVPTAAGVPLAIKLDVAALVHVKGSVGFKGISAISELISGAPVTSPVTGTVALASTVAIHGRFGIAWDATVIRAGAAIQATAHIHAPVEGSVWVDLAAMVIKKRFVLPAVSKTLAFIEVAPVVYVHTMLPAPSAALYSAFEAFVSWPETLQNVTVATGFAVPATGHSVKVAGVFSICGAGFSPVFPLCGRTAITVGLAVDAAKPAAKYVEFEIIFAKTRVPTKASPARGGWSHWIAPAAAASGWSSAFSPLVVNPNIDVDASAVRTVSAIFRIASAKGIFVVARSKVAIVTGPWMMTHQINVQAIVEKAMGFSKFPIKVLTEATVFLPNILSVIWPDVAPVKPVDKVAIVDALAWRGDEAIWKSNLSFHVGAMDITTELPVFAKAFVSSWFAPLARMPVSRLAAAKAFEMSVLADVSRMPSAFMETSTAFIASILAIAQPWMKLTTVPVWATVPAATSGKIAIVVKAIPAWEQITILVRGRDGSSVATTMPFGFPWFYDMSLSGPLPAFLGGWAAAAAPAPAFGFAKVSSIGSRVNSPAAAAAAAGVCRVEGRTVTSVFGQSVALPVGAAESCEVVVAKDCDESGKFTILMSPAAAVAEWKSVDASTRAVRVIASGVSIVVASVKGKIACMVNGVVRPVSAVPSVIAVEKGAVVVSFSKGMAVVAVRHLGIIVRTDCARVWVETTGAFAGSMCGACGLPRAAGAGRVASAMARLFVFSEACAARLQMKSVGKCSATTLRNVVVAEGVNRCISRVPVSVCPAGCTPTATVVRSVPVHCAAAIPAAILRAWGMGYVSAAAFMPVSGVRMVTVHPACAA